MIVVPTSMPGPLRLMPSCTVPDTNEVTFSVVPEMLPIKLAVLLSANAPAGVTNSGISLPLTVISNVRSAIRSGTSMPFTIFSVYALSVNLLVTSSLTSVGTPCKLATACGTPAINPVALH